MVLQHFLDDVQIEITRVDDLLVVASLFQYLDLVLLLLLQRLVDALVVEVQHVLAQGSLESGTAEEHPLEVDLFDGVALHVSESFDEVLASALIQHVEPTYDCAIPQIDLIVRLLIDLEAHGVLAPGHK